MSLAVWHKGRGPSGSGTLGWTLDPELQQQGHGQHPPLPGQREGYRVPRALGHGGSPPAPSEVAYLQLVVRVSGRRRFRVTGGSPLTAAISPALEHPRPGPSFPQTIIQVTPFQPFTGHPGLPPAPQGQWLAPVKMAFSQGPSSRIFSISGNLCTVLIQYVFHLSINKFT